MTVWEGLILGVVLALCLAYVARRIWRKLKGSSVCDGCPGATNGQGCDFLPPDRPPPGS